MNFCEFDKYASKAYAAIHEEDEFKNLGDITKVDEKRLPHYKMICGGSPCQDFSVAGVQSGSVWKCNKCGKSYNPLTVHWSKRDKCPNCGCHDLDKTRSSLLVEWLRIIRYNKPEWAIYENVKNIIGKKFKPTFDMFVKELQEYGYNVYYTVLNAKDFGVPQNRERLYLIIIREELDNGQFEFPQGFDSDIRLRDVLEEEVADNFYVNTPNAERLIEELKASGKLEKEFSKSIKAGGAWKSRQTRMGQSNRTLTALVSNYAGQYNHYMDQSCTLQARDYKGFGRQAQTCVIDEQKNEQN